KCRMVALSVRRIAAVSNLLFGPDAQESEYEQTQVAGHMVLLADRGHYGISVVRQHHPLQCLDRQIRCTWHFDRLAAVSRVHRRGQHGVWRTDGRVETDWDPTNSDDDFGSELSRGSNRCSKLCRPGLGRLGWRCSAVT